MSTGVIIEASRNEFSNERQQPGFFHGSVIDQFVQNDFFGAVSDAVHLPHPFHLIFRYQPIKAQRWVPHSREALRHR